jgi:hypothetical protein
MRVVAKEKNYKKTHHMKNQFRRLISSFCQHLAIFSHPNDLWNISNWNKFVPRPSNYFFIEQGFQWSFPFGFTAMYNYCLVKTSLQTDLNNEMNLSTYYNTIN